MEAVSTRRSRALDANYASGEDTDAARPDEQPDNDQHDAAHDPTAKQCDDACNHENDGDQPEYELHASISLERPRPSTTVDAGNSRSVGSPNGNRLRRRRSGVG